jgi:anti-sigma28 factor (negative regulator of flagellin synthesis)
MRIDALNRTPIPDAESLATPDANRIEQLRLQIESGDYDVSAEAVAAAIVDSHLKE